MIRNSFNGGELSPEMQMRADVEIYERGCELLENFDVKQTGGVTRRRGFRYVADAQGSDSRIFCYRYRNDVRYLVEIGRSKLIVRDTEGALVAEFPHSWSPDAVRGMYTLQVNALLLLLSSNSYPMQLICGTDGAWTLDTYTFKVPPWRHTAYRDEGVTVVKRSDGNYRVELPESDETEGIPQAGDLLRVSYYTEPVNIQAKASEIFAQVSVAAEKNHLHSGIHYSAGTIIAVRQEAEAAVYSCIKDFDAKTMFVKGLIDPANYTGNFQLASDGGTADADIAELSESTSYTQGQRIRYQQGYWVIYTCIEDFDGGVDLADGKTDVSDYPGHFAVGMMIGSAPCKGKWNFYTSGTWYGSYEVRASYTGKQASGDWEYRSESFSRNASPSNSPVAGDESEEECWVSLWLTRVRAYGNIWNVRNFPADNCGNVLTIAGYKHDLVLRYIESNDESGEEHFEQIERVPTEISGNIESEDWSWSAFSDRYGYPRTACVLNQRLVFAGTRAQPQSIWMSRVDDIDNFDMTTADDGAIALTMSTSTQDPIRWMMSQNGRIMLGTEEGEYVIQSGTGNALSGANAAVNGHGFIGSADMNALQCSDKIIYIERGGGRAMQYGYAYDQDAYISTDLTVFADHILARGGGAIEGTVMRKPDAKAVLVLADGTIACMTYNTMHQVNAWHRYRTQGQFKSVAMLPNGNAADSLYAVVVRDGKAYIEVMDETSGYTDHGGLDYSSVLLTNCLQSGSLGREKMGESKVMLYLTEDTQVAGLELSADGGERWAAPNRAPSATLKKGWYEDAAYGHYKREKSVGFRVSGDRPLGVLALQG